MNAPAQPIAVAAGPFQVGLVCPRCQRAVAEGEAVVSCPACAIAHHAGCWREGGGRCASYHCDPRTSAAGAVRPEIVVTAAEAARAVPPAPRVPQASAAVAAREAAAVRGEARLSRAAAVAAGAGAVLLGAAALALVGGRAGGGGGGGAGAGAWTPALALGMLVAITASFGNGVLGAIAMARVHGDRRLRGWGLGAAGVGCSVAAAIAFIASVAGLDARTFGGGRGRIEITAPEPPSEESFAHAPPPIANAMRANVYVAGAARGAGGLATLVWCGAGVILGTAPGGEVYILTNRHVIEGGGGGGRGELSVTFASGERASAEVEWLAPGRVDLGVLRARPRAAPAVVRTRLREAPLMIGEKVFAIGNPLRLSWSYTDGSVSRVHERRSVAGADAVEVVQTQTPIQQGNSGGGLYDDEGRLVGVNTWASMPEEGRGPGFAISSRSVRALVPARILDVAAGEGSGEGER